MAEEEKEKENSGIWYSILDTALKIPGAKVDRDDFLKKGLSDCGGDMLAHILEVGPGRAGIPVDTLDKAADKEIREHTAVVTGTSFLAGLPGGIAMAGTIPADLAQYYWHVIVIAQKLAYIYGWPDLQGESREDYLSMLTILIGIMSGAKEASEVFKPLCESLSKEAAVKKLPAVMLAKAGVPQIVKQVAIRLGANLAKQGLSKGISKIIPILGGAISGAVSFLTFKPMAETLKDALRVDIFPLLTDQRNN
ncbi:MAG: hypothetical protein LBD13_06170 [Spirochaetaceae bacterium]|jgi:hypothetical protein|nr:hypothetical protein [Spirochaetaceae bacterium]